MKSKLLFAALVLLSFLAGVVMRGRWIGARLLELYEPNAELAAAEKVARSVQILSLVQTGNFEALQKSENLFLDMALDDLRRERELHPDQPLVGAPQAAVCRAQIYRAKFPRLEPPSAYDRGRQARVDQFLATPK